MKIGLEAQCDTRVKLNLWKVINDITSLKKGLLLTHFAFLQEGRGDSWPHFFGGASLLKVFGFPSSLTYVIFWILLGIARALLTVGME